MTKKKILIGIGGLITIGIITGTLFFGRHIFFPQKSAQTKGEESITPTPKVDLLTWDDPAGFSFQYPKGLEVNAHEEDTVNYAHVELTNPEYKGSIVIWGKDTTATTIAQWLKNEKSLKDAVSIDTTLGGNEAKKVALKGPKIKQIIATLDEDILVMIEMDLEDQKFWQQVGDMIAGSFTFTNSQKENATDNASSGEEPPAAADEEESVE